jgi:hypothetical protein
MTRNLLIGIAAVGVISATTAVSALAGTVHGHARPTTAVQASLNFCSHQTAGQSRTAPAFQQCMATRGYQLAHAASVRATTAVRTKTEQPQSTRNAKTYISDTGMICRDVGGIGICDPPQGTVNYISRHGLNCRRTGLVSICSNL